jgi:hypothetical protein
VAADHADFKREKPGFTLAAITRGGDLDEA